MMKQTQAAKNWLWAARRYMIRKAYIALLEEAKQVARERGATRLGRIHCEIALSRLADEC